MANTINKLIGTIVPIAILLVGALLIIPRVLTYIQDYKANQDATKAKQVQDAKDQQNGFLGYLADNIFGAGTADSIRTSLGFGTPDSSPSNAGSGNTKDTTISTDKTTSADKTTPSDSSQKTDPLTSFVNTLTNLFTGKSNTSTSPSGETVKTDTNVKTDKTNSTDTKNVSDTQTNKPDTSIIRPSGDTAKALQDFLNLPNEKPIGGPITGIDLTGNITKTENEVYQQSKAVVPQTPSTKPIKRDPFDSSVYL